MKELELYIHIPFCERKCLYCDFLSFPCDKEERDAYFIALINEIRAASFELREYIVVSVFIGGGTPSLVDEKYIASIMKVVRENYKLSKDCEITIEANPNSITEEKLRTWKEVYINRISIGLQSSNDDELKKLGRLYNYAEFERAYSEAVRAGFENINVDIMSDIPGQTLESYKSTLKKVTELKPAPEHISAYSLIVEEGTPFYDMSERGELNIPDEDIDREMYAFTKEYLEEKGYKRYEISNYAKDGYECRHNLGYWMRREYRGFGLGAASLIENERVSNTEDFEVYIKYWRNAPLTDADPDMAPAVTNIQRLSINDRMEETMFLGLRTIQGVDIEGFRKAFGRDIFEVYGKAIEKNINDGLLETKVCSKTGENAPHIYLALTDKGLDVSNYVMAQFLL